MESPASLSMDRSFLYFFQGIGMNFWPPKPGFTDMIRNISASFKNAGEGLHRCRRVQSHSRLAAALPDLVQSPVQMAAGLLVDADQIGSGLFISATYRPGSSTII